jgi:hypothetical protein
MNNSTPPVGLLASMIGYEADRVQSAILRNPPAACAEFFLLKVADGGIVRRGLLGEAREHWGARWVRVEWDPLPAGEYELRVPGMPGPSAFIRVGEDVLWQETFHHVAVDQMNRRAHVVSSRLGWQDCGFPLREANSHAACMIGLADALQFRGEELSEVARGRLRWHLAHGSRYLAKLQDIAAEKHGVNGGLVHAMETHESDVLFDDATKAVVAWLHALRELAEHDAAERSDWLRRARAAYDWAARCAPPSAKSFDPIPHGAPPDFVPAPEFATNQLMMRAWAAYELVAAGQEDLADDFFDLLRQLMARQIEPATAAGVSGHFRLFSTGELTNKAWTHHLPKQALGYDLGATFPDYLLPFIRAAQRWPDHADAPRWLETVRRYAYGYYLPAARANAFRLLPLGDFGPEGLLWFAGSWHGANALYGFAAALGCEFAALFDDPEFERVAYDNLQWIAGRNCGLTAESLKHSVIFSCDVPAGVALPVSMIHGVGRRWAGGFACFRGGICNGFSAGDAFVFDVPAKREKDAPSAFTDEDWITHAGAWLSGLARLGRLHRPSLTAAVVAEEVLAR